MISPSLQQNDIADRENCTLLDMFRSMMEPANLPINFGGDALLMAAYFFKYVPSKSIYATLYEL